MLVTRFNWVFSISITTSTKLKTFILVLTYTKNVREPWSNNVNFKGKAQLIFLYNPQKSSANVCLMKKLKSTVTKKVIVWFYYFCEEKFWKLKVAAFVYNISNFYDGFVWNPSKVQRSPFEQIACFF